MQIDHDTAVAVAVAELDRLAAAAATLSDDELLGPSRCHGWTAGDVLVHVHLGLQEMLLGLVDPTDDEPDVDAASYWQGFAPTDDGDGDAVAQIRFTRLLASAYRRPGALVDHLRPTVDGVVRACTTLVPGVVRFQGHVLRTGDFVATWAVELAVHHLDLLLPADRPGPTDASLAVARQTVEALAGGRLPAGWSDETVVLLGSGRVPLTPQQRSDGGPSAARLPVLG